MTWGRADDSGRWAIISGSCRINPGCRGRGGGGDGIFCEACLSVWRATRGLTIIVVGRVVVSGTLQIQQLSLPIEIDYLLLCCVEIWKMMPD